MTSGREQRLRRAHAEATSRYPRAVPLASRTTLYLASWEFSNFVASNWDLVREPTVKVTKYMWGRMTSCAAVANRRLQFLHFVRDVGRSGSAGGLAAGAVPSA
jgi:hypothetical protein